MAGELQCSYVTAKNVYFLVRSSVGTIWNTAGGALEAYLTANYTDYDIAATEQGTASAYYTADFPATLVNGRYNYVAKERAGGSPAESDITVATGEIVWAGPAVALVPLVNTSGAVLVGSGLFVSVPIVSISGVNVVVPPANLSGVFSTASLNSGQVVLVYSGQLSGQLVDANIRSGGFVVASLNSGQVVNLYSGERVSIANAILDLPQSLESGTGTSGLTVRQAFRGIAAATFGVSSGFLSGMVTATARYQNAVNNDKVRLIAAIDSFGNRSGITVDLT